MRNVINYVVLILVLAACGTDVTPPKPTPTPNHGGGGVLRTIQIIDLSLMTDVCIAAGDAFAMHKSSDPAVTVRVYMTLSDCNTDSNVTCTLDGTNTALNGCHIATLIETFVSGPYRPQFISSDVLYVMGL